jgi:seryl-tRNA synthetase
LFFIKDLIKETCKNTKERMTNQSKRINELQQQELELKDKIENLSEEENEKLKQIGEELNLIKSNSNLEKEYINKLKNLFEKLSNLQIQIVQAEQRKNLTLTNEIRLKLIPELKKEILEIEYRLVEENKHQKGQLLIEVVGPDAIMEKGLF